MVRYLALDLPPPRMLPELMPGDLFATPPGNPIEQSFAFVMNSETYHWGMVVHSYMTEAGMDYEIMESIPRGISVGILGKMYGDKAIRVYRVKVSPRPSASEVEWVANGYGRSFYGFVALPGVVIWLIGNHISRALSLKPPALNPDAVICSAFVTLVWRDLGVDLVPQSAYPTPDMVEKSESLECIYREY